MTNQAASHEKQLYGKMYRAFVGVATLCGIVIVFTFQITAPIIADNKNRALEAAIFKVLPGVKTKKTFYLDATGKFVENEITSGQLIYAAYNSEQQLVGFAIPAQGMGYQDNIQLLYSYDPMQQAVIGLQILQSRETPGLGSRIEEDPAFLANFHKLDVQLDSMQNALVNPVTMVKPGQKTTAWQIDSISGATISSRAVGKIIQQSASFWLPQIQQRYEDFKFGN